MRVLLGNMKASAKYDFTFFSLSFFFFYKLINFREW